ncbi:MAG: DUF262 domain-containing protein [Bacteroidetes bacterium]|nr:DUF262 domain-containing protein [Bacteroidota bacterium]
MMGIQKKEIQNIAQFLSNPKLEIPLFQRPYKWTTKNVIQLIDDVQRFQGDNPYRIGTIVIYKDEKGNNKIVDGQQRSITFLLITKAIQTKRLQSLNNIPLKNRIAALTSFVPSFKNEISFKNIQDNYREIERKIDRVGEAFIDYFYNKCEITYFVIDDVSEAFQFFDSQNSRGRDLEPHDLLKAFHLRELEGSENTISEMEVANLVDTWEDMEIIELATLFADFMYRVRGWSKGNSSRYFTKKDTPLFKGINLSKIGNDPYTKIYKMADEQIHDKAKNGNATQFPFQLDQVIINGSYFFEMVTHYKNMIDTIKSLRNGLSTEAQDIINTLDNYEGKSRTGDKYIRMLFDCAVLYFMDKFGSVDLSKAIEKIFIWAYTPRLTYQSLQLATVDNYVVKELNFFRIIRDATYKEDVINYPIPEIREDYESDKTSDLKTMFKKMHYYAVG